MRVGGTHGIKCILKNIGFTSKGIWTMVGIQIAWVSAHACKSRFFSIICIHSTRELGTESRE